MKRRVQVHREKVRRDADLDDTAFGISQPTNIFQYFNLALNPISRFKEVAGHEISCCRYVGRLGSLDHAVPQLEQACRMIALYHGAPRRVTVRCTGGQLESGSSMPVVQQVDVSYSMTGWGGLLNTLSNW